ncbi:hypothetical protein C7271_04605 [filamentous cyanobacterium CCP5]|nr:hypothetical protein C7271_04605 [filamentous cyanobacterium CCP5]
MIQRQKYKALSRGQVFSISVFVTLALMGIANFDVTQQQTSVQASGLQSISGLFEDSPDSRSFQLSGLEGRDVADTAKALQLSQLNYQQLIGTQERKPVGKLGSYRPAAYSQP